MSSLHEAAESDRRFNDARRRAMFSDMARALTRHTTTLVPFEEVRTRLRSTSEIQRGTQMIPLDAIVGSVGRYRDFTREFLPRSQNVSERWRRLDEAYNRMDNIPPIDVYKLGDVYFVRDGNHRVSVARANGSDAIEANVTEIPLKAPITPNMNVDDIILAVEEADFLERTDLPALRPDASIKFTAPGRYAQVLDHIDVHRWYLGNERAAEIPYAEAVTSWYDNVYLPAVEAVHASGVIGDFPGRTDADLYLWTMHHLAELREQYGDAVDEAMAASDLARSRPPTSVERVVRAVKDLVGGGDDVPPIVQELLEKYEAQEKEQGNG